VLLLSLAALGIPLAVTGIRHKLSVAFVPGITLPYQEPVIPPGPNHEQFTALCRLCHSPSLVLTQPRFSEKKWSEVVHKMVTVYGAPIPAEQEREIVAYLVSIRGPE
jgi:hypothetical protein